MLQKCIFFLALIYLCVLAGMAWGIAVYQYHIFPYQTLKHIQRVMAGDPEDNKTALQRLTMHPQEHEITPTPAGIGTIDGFKQIDPSFKDPGYLLISRFSRKHQQAIVELVRLADFTILHTWIPPIEQIVEQGAVHGKDNFRAQHPLLLKDGSLIIGDGEGPLARIDRQSKLQWVIPRLFHHTIELDHQNRLIVPIVCTQTETWRVAEPELRGKNRPYRDDGYAIVSLDGKLLETRSVTQILLDNGYDGLLLGQIGQKQMLHWDNIHLNDAQPILKSGHGSKQGDIALSMRRLSAVCLYRPATNTILWLRTGPWIRQHDINPLPDGRFSIFGNDGLPESLWTRIRNRKNKWNLKPTQFSNVYIFDPQSNQITAPFQSILKKMGLFTKSQGRSRILPNNDLFFDESNRCRIWRLSKNKVRWVYHNRLDDQLAGSVHWPRYLPASQINLDWLNQTVSDSR